MSTFRFSLQKVLDWRSTQLDLEESTFQRLIAQRNDLDRAREELRTAGTQAELQVRASQAVESTDLTALSAFRRHLTQKEQEIARHRAACETAIEKQRGAMVEAQRRCRLLERLKERRRAEWQSAVDRGLEELAAESFLARWNARI